MQFYYSVYFLLVIELRECHISQLVEKQKHCDIKKCRNVWKVIVKTDKTQDKFWLVEDTNVVPWSLPGRWTSVFLIQRTQWEELKNSVFSCWPICKRLGNSPRPGLRAIPFTSDPWMPDSDSLWWCQAPKGLVAGCRLRIEFTMTGQKHSEHSAPSLPAETSSESHFFMAHHTRITYNPRVSLFVL